jgi:hypothetical protein
MFILIFLDAIHHFHSVTSEWVKPSQHQKQTTEYQMANLLSAKGAGRGDKLGICPRPLDFLKNQNWRNE